MFALNQYLPVKFRQHKCAGEVENIGLNQSLPEHHIQTRPVNVLHVTSEMLASLGQPRTYINLTQIPNSLKTGLIWIIDSDSNVLKVVFFIS